jgi:hypothetical protein
MRIFRIGKLKSTPDEVFGTHKRNAAWKMLFASSEVAAQ